HRRQVRCSPLSQLESTGNCQLTSRGKIMLHPPYAGRFMSHVKKQRIQIQLDSVDGRQSGRSA
ncbi:MAG: hypothetical protein AB7S98_22405, partial [Burkholderiaceae bacterium]